MLHRAQSTFRAGAYDAMHLIIRLAAEFQYFQSNEGKKY